MTFVKFLFNSSFCSSYVRGMGVWRGGAHPPPYWYGIFIFIFIFISSQGVAQRGFQRDGQRLEGAVLPLPPPLLHGTYARIGVRIRIYTDPSLYWCRVSGVGCRWVGISIAHSRSLDLIGVGSFSFFFSLRLISISHVQYYLYLYTTSIYK